MALAVVTPKHLEKIGLLKKEQLESNEKVELVNGHQISKNDLTYLFSKSLDKVKYNPIYLISTYTILNRQNIVIDIPFH